MTLKSAIFLRWSERDDAEMGPAQTRSTFRRNTANIFNLNFVAAVILILMLFKKSVSVSVSVQFQLVYL